MFCERSHDCACVRCVTERDRLRARDAEMDAAGRDANTLLRAAGFRGNARETSAKGVTLAGKSIPNGVRVGGVKPVAPDQVNVRNGIGSLKRAKPVSADEQRARGAWERRNAATMRLANVGRDVLAHAPERTEGTWPMPDLAPNGAIKAKETSVRDGAVEGCMDAATLAASAVAKSTALDKTDPLARTALARKAARIESKERFFKKAGAPSRPRFQVKPQW
jgi:hypothetical protein